MTDDEKSMPTLVHLTDLLARFIGSDAYVIPMTSAHGTKALGNNGDAIMHDVFYRILDAMGIRLTTDPQAASVLLVPPNGALLQVYQFPEILRSRLRGLEGVPLVIFPSSALFPTRDPAFIFDGRRAETIWILREKYSFAHLRDQWGESLAKVGVSLALDHDVVASGHQFVKEILGPAQSGGGALLAGRKDKEATDIRKIPSVSHPAGPDRWGHVKDLLPYGVPYTTAVRLIRRRELEAAASTLVSRLPRALQDEVTSVKRGVHVDLSAVQYATYPQYLRTLRRADLVVTNRLHVALPAAVLGKRVLIVEAGYHKLQGVYEQSLRGLEHVTLTVGS